MQDRFKFRAWNGEKMIYNAHNNSPLILMQCTSYKDVQGKLIYEGCIVQEYGDSGKKWVIEYSKDYYRLLAKSIKEDVYDELDELPNCEIIGNIYENKELLND